MRSPVGASLYASVPPPAPLPMMITSYSLVIARLLPSDECNGRGPRAGCAAQLRMSQDEGELADGVGGERARIEVLDDEDAVLDVQELRHLEGAQRILGGHGAVAPGVAAGQGDLVLDQPPRDVETGAGLARE